MNEIVIFIILVAFYLVTLRAADKFWKNNTTDRKIYNKKTLVMWTAADFAVGGLSLYVVNQFVHLVRNL